jgi:polyvinyl alcohol dehydrogenase (cytochrome)
MSKPTGKHRSSNWPSYGKDLSNQRDASDGCQITRCNVKDLRLTWTFNTGLGIDVSANPAVVDNVAYFGDDADFYFETGNIYAVNTRDGTIIWKTPLPGSDMCILTPAVGSTFVYFGSFNCIVYAVNKINGTIQWATQLPIQVPGLQNILSAPLLIEKEEIVIVNTAASLPPNELPICSGLVSSLNSTTGEINWTYQTTLNTTPGQPNTGGSGVGMFGSPAADTKRGLVFIGTGENFAAPITPLSDSLLALNYRTSNPNGQLVWYHQYTNDDLAVATGSPPTYNITKDWDADGGPILLSIKNKKGCEKDIVVVGTKQGNVYAHKRNNGKLIWTAVLTNPNPQPSWEGGVNTFGCSDGEVIYMPSFYTLEGLPISVNYYDVNTMGAELIATGIFAIRASDGKILWRKDFGGATFGALTVANGVLYHVASYGSLAKSPVTTPTTTVGAILRGLDTRNGDVLFEYVNKITNDPQDNVSLAGVAVVKNTVYFPWGQAMSAENLGGGIKALKLSKH